MSFHKNKPRRWRPALHFEEENSMKYFRLAVVAGILGTALVSTGTPVFAQAGNEWTKYGGDYANTRYSTLDQINVRNVSKLKVAWIHSLGALETQEATPLIVGDTMYVSSSTGPKHVFALDAKTGKIKWKYDPELPADYMATVCCGLDSRGVAHANGMIFFRHVDREIDRAGRRDR